MDYNSLKYIITVHKYQSISKAAEELYLSQPNISKAIQNIEKEIGFTIFTRTSRGVITTFEGKEFIKKAKELVNKFDEFSKEFSASNKNLFTINIAHPQDNYYNEKISNFMSKFKGEKILNINILDGTMEEIIDMVVKDVANLGIICVNQFELAYYKRLLQLNNLEIIVKDPVKLKAVTGNKNPLFKQKIVNNEDLKHQTIVVNNSNDYYNYYGEKYNLVLGENVIRVPGGLNQLSILNKVPNSYILTLPLPEEILKLFNCKSIDFEANNNEWYIIIIYKKETKLTEKETKLIGFF
jgi:D-Tyr-tRNAtyr deacylase